MCGIVAGNYSPNRCGQAIDYLTPRGPDKNCSIQWGNAFMGHTLLAVHSSDIRGSVQPICDHGLAVCMNGELYNYHELRSNLEKLEYKFNTSSDAEVLVHGFDYYGREYVKQLDGEYAIVCYDIHQQEWTCITDRWGSKPLKWHNDPTHGFAVASNVGALKELGVDVNLDIESVLHTLSHSVAPYGRTLFKNINFIPPRSILTINNNGVATVETYSIEVTPFIHNQHYLEGLIESSIMRRVPQHHRLAVALSGGIDSGILPHYLLKNGVDFTAYTISFPGSEYDEVTDVKAYCSRHGIKLDTLELTSEDNRNAFVESILNCETLVLNSHSSSKLLLNRYISERVALTGDGGDEQFWGYSHLYEQRHQHDIDSRRTGRSWLQYIDPSHTVTLSTTLQSFPTTDTESDSSVDLYKKTWLHQYGLHILGDSQSASVGQEHRYPLLDYRIDNYLRSIGDVGELNRPGKKLLRDIIKEWDPLFAQTPKRPFIAPVIDKSWMPLVNEYILDNNELDIGLFNLNTVRAYTSTLTTDTPPNRKLISQLLSLGIIMKRICNG